MKKVNLYILLSLSLSMLFFTLEGASTAQVGKGPATQSSSPKTTTAHMNDDDDDDDDDYDDDDYDDDDDEDDNGYYNIMKKDQIDNSNTLAIPFDDSEIEDEEEINRDERKNTFSLPRSR